MIALLQAMLPLLVAAPASDTPPHTPNFCTQAFCLELQPMLHKERKGFVKIQKDLLELDGQAWARFQYGDLGTVSVHGPFASSAKANSAIYDRSTEEIVVNACSNDQTSGQTCRRYLISISDNKLGKKPLVCSIVSFWPAAAEGNSPNVQMGARIDVSEKLAERCL